LRPLVPAGRRPSAARPRSWSDQPTILCCLSNSTLKRKRLTPAGDSEIFGLTKHTSNQFGWVMQIRGTSELCRVSTRCPRGPLHRKTTAVETRPELLGSDVLARRATQRAATGQRVHRSSHLLRLRTPRPERVTARRVRNVPED